ncbi:PKD domain-containing protein [Muriicola jejuensis]|uniref:PKD domain-containing protein n=1 Tax=Muriicola jejuensis TaxID=504488 RepID=A0A6P0UBK0_9FLAO|nr:PKD domain-containing protein [Muriicola jejuensis]NER10584.1 PKD domain-containing protein [Muriicola jejuensis]SMP17791.1 PKD domain-containing protein [Muriicola jejuensis]
MKSFRILIGLMILLLHLQCSNDDGNTTPERSTPPIAEFNALATTIRAGTRVQFVNGSLNATSYLWSFPGGTPDSSTEVEPFIQYLNPGTYDVSLTAINSEGNNTQTRENFITVVDPN